jgi:hypothetical protein
MCGQPSKSKVVLSLVDPRLRQQRNGKESVQIQCNRILKRVTVEKGNTARKKNLGNTGKHSPKGLPVYTFVLRSFSGYALFKRHLA